MTQSTVAIDDPFRTAKAYTVSDAAKLAKTTAATVRRWLLGYDAPGHHMEPVFGLREIASGEALRVSFLELIEIVVCVRFRNDEEVRLGRIRAAHQFARKVMLVPFPFASMEFTVMGGHIIHQFEESEPGAGHMAFDLHGQWVLPGVVREVLETIDFAEDHLAARWFPYGKTANIVVDPHLAAGRPVIRGTRIPTVIVRERFKAGESIQFLAADYGIKPPIVEEILRFDS
jgi:uncharacterized protein (DUF433 family)